MYHRRKKIAQIINFKHWDKNERDTQLCSFLIEVKDCLQMTYSSIGRYMNTLHCNMLPHKTGSYNKKLSVQIKRA